MGRTIIETFDTSNYEWVNIEALNGGKKFASIKQLIYQVMKDGNISYYGRIALDNNGSNDFDKEVVNTSSRDVLDLDFDIVVNYKDKNLRPLQVKKLKGVQISGSENSQGYTVYNILFLGTTTN
ncbi:hypothetical protein CJD36_016715 [Flavipsychrobacter stenotrophus]|uniref:Uncharacterized protein n=1 Tax=Flavipsychrobacter stenotrophus TaxID=2077091 RepID=A0A2S7SSH2_9BACT|nr:hypothetical protein [Flavipsychrobacter stenotrophus]PQJ09581.1 hypothetical protein CJD36_016715 [Flavipsychrobacter stenotrophus]